MKARNIFRSLSLVAVVLVAWAFPKSSSAESWAQCTENGAPASMYSNMDDYYVMWGNNGWKCEQAYIDWWWDEFDFDKKYWDDGQGFYRACDYSRPLARIFNGMYVLGYSGSTQPTCNWSGQPIIRRSMCWAARKIKSTKLGCWEGKRATTTGSSVEYFYSFIYGPSGRWGSPVNRAGTIFHEARHADGCSHNGGTRCPSGGSCDKRWTNGCSTSSSGGANRYHAEFLAAYLRDGTRLHTSFLRAEAKNHVDYIINKRFEYKPCHRYDSRGNVVKTC